MPTFALLALVVHLIGIPQLGADLLPGQLAYSLGPMMILWITPYSIGHARVRFGKSPVNGSWEFSRQPNHSQNS